jgi:hypothetical protein
MVASTKYHDDDAFADFASFPPSLPSSLRYDAASRFGATSAKSNKFSLLLSRATA